MNELERMCTEVPPPAEATVVEGRRRLLAAARGEHPAAPVSTLSRAAGPAPVSTADSAAGPSHRPRTGRPHAGRPRTRRQWRVAVSAGVAAALAVSVPVALRIGGDQAEQPQRIQAVSASEVLHRAAASARTEPELRLHDRQYLYVKTKVAWGPGVSRPGQPKGGEVREVWLSVDGSRPDLLRTACWKDPARICDTPLVNDDAPAKPVLPTPGSYRWTVRHLPELLRGWRADLTRPNPRPTEPPGKGGWDAVSDLLGESYLPPDLRAQVFDFLADVPGTTVRHNAVDALGRPGVAVTKTMYGVRKEFIFDRTGYRFLGSRDIYLGPPRKITDWRRQPEGSDFDLASTVLAVKAVDRLPARR